MTTLEAIILGIIQGLTEFLPVSSSGHLALGQYLLGFKNLKDFIFFDLVCHLGTLVAICFVYANEIRRILTDDRKFILRIILGLLPLFPLLLVLKPVKETFNQPQLLGFFFMTTSLLLYLGIKFVGVLKKVIPQNKYGDAFIVGIFQALAIFPGISRSGSTISGARLLGWDRAEAVSFSFLLAIPTILGGSILEVTKVCTSDEAECIMKVSFLTYVAGFITSLLVGFGALKLLIRLVREDKLIFFVWYCLLLGLICLSLFPYPHLVTL